MIITVEPGFTWAIQDEKIYENGIEISPGKLQISAPRFD